MAGETIITVVGNLTSDPELRFTPSGAAVANFTIASTPRTFDRQANEWKDGETLFLRASIWREAAENVAESLTKGTRVIAQGALKMRAYEKDGQKRTSTELDVHEIGPSLKYATARVTKANRSNERPSDYARPGSQPGNAGFNTEPASNGGQGDPWGGGQQAAGDWGTPGGDDGAPF